MTVNNTNEYLTVAFEILKAGLVAFTGSILNPANYASVEVIAANPIDRRMSYGGSGLPFPNAEVAFEGTPNRLNLAEGASSFRGEFAYPNRYYLPDARTVIAPSVFFVLTPKIAGAEPIYVRYELPIPSDELKLRSLNHREGRRVAGPAFYSHKEDLIGIEGAEKTMRLYGDYKIKYNIA